MRALRTYSYIHQFLFQCEFPIDSPDGDSSEKESDAEEGKAKEAEDDWIQYYYQLEDPHEFLIQKVFRVFLFSYSHRK